MGDQSTAIAAQRSALPRGLSPRAERVARAAIEAVLTDEDAAGNLVPPPRATCDRAVDWLTSSAAFASGDLRRGLSFLTFLLQLLPIVIIGVPSRMTSLSLADRIRYLEALETHRIGLFAMLAIAFKVPMSIAAFEEGAELRSTGFDRPSTTSRRSLLVAAEPVEVPATNDGTPGNEGVSA